MENSEKRIIVASHREDLDGIASAALIKRIYPEAIIFLTTPTEIMQSKMHFDIVIDLPKPRYCKINIDHHVTNYQRLVSRGELTKNDLVDPSAPSAAYLVAKYFNLNDEISKELVEMANLADTGQLNDDLLLLDLYIKSNITNTNKLLWLIDKLSQHGKKIIFSMEANNEFKQAKELLRQYHIIKGKVEDLVKTNIETVIFDATNLPYALAKLPPTIFVREGGIIGISYYIDPLNGKIRFSIRLNETAKLNAHEIAKHFGGGGHKLAAGFTIDHDEELGYVLYRCLHLLEVNSFILIRINLDEGLNQKT